VLGVDALGHRQEAGAGQQVVEDRGVALDHRALRGQLELDGLVVHALEQAEVEERDGPVLAQQEVAGMRIARELMVAVERAQEEAEDDLAEAVALGL
jgi:hypothetical protein